MGLSNEDETSLPDRDLGQKLTTPDSHTRLLLRVVFLHLFPLTLGQKAGRGRDVPVGTGRNLVSCVYGRLQRRSGAPTVHRREGRCESTVPTLMFLVSLVP